MAKKIEFNIQAREGIKRGVDALANAVKVTLGPKGRNVIIGKSFGAPQVTKDGVTVAKEIELKDNLENMGAQMLKEVASKTNDLAGDGTTTATILAQSIVNEGLKNVAAGANPMDLKRGIDKAVTSVVQDLEKQSVEIGSASDKILQVASISANNDLAIGTLITEAFEHSNLVMVEEYIHGRELTVTVLGEKAYPIVEIKPSHEFYDYECKYTPGMSHYICPADIPEELTKSIQNNTEIIFKALGCDVYARADYLLLENGKYYFLEMNTLPGMTSTSLVPKSVNATGMSFEELIKIIIELSL